MKLSSIVYKRTDEWYVKWQRVTTGDNEWQRVTPNTNEWSEWQRVAQRETTSERQGVTPNDKWQQMTTSDNKWQRVVILANFPFFFSNKRGTYHYAP